MPRNAPSAPAMAGSAVAVADRLLAPLGMRVGAGEPLRDSEMGYALAAWTTSEGRLLVLAEAETGGPAQWASYHTNTSRAAAWLDDQEGRLATGLLRSMGFNGSALEVGSRAANTSQVFLTQPLPGDLGELPALQAFADVYTTSDQVGGTLQLRLFPLHDVDPTGMATPRAGLEGKARDFLDCWLAQKAGSQDGRTVQALPAFPLVRGEGLRLRVPYLVEQGADSCLVTVDVDAVTGAIWAVRPAAGPGQPIPGCAARPQ